MAVGSVPFDGVGCNKYNRPKPELQYLFLAGDSIARPKTNQVNELLHSLTETYTPIRELTDHLILFGLQGFDRQLFLPTLFLNN